MFINKQSCGVVAWQYSKMNKNIKNQEMIPICVNLYQPTYTTTITLPMFIDVRTGTIHFHSIRQTDTEIIKNHPCNQQLFSLIFE